MIWYGNVTIDCPIIQADVCHAYQILIKNGVPAENIITMMVDDIAHSPE